MTALGRLVQGVVQGGAQRVAARRTCTFPAVSAGTPWFGPFAAGVVLAFSVFPLPAALSAAPAEEPARVAFARSADPQVELPDLQLVWAEGLGALWRQALEGPDADLRRQAADTIAQANRWGMPGLETMNGALLEVLEAADDDPAPRLAAATALVALDAREAADQFVRQARDGRLELRMVVEPALAKWDHRPARALWLSRLANPTTPAGLLQLTIRCLGRVRSAEAIPDLQRLMTDRTVSPMIRLAAARALSELPADDLPELAERLAADASPRAWLDRLAGVELLDRQSGDTVVALLQRYAADAEPTVAAAAMQRLLELAPDRLVQRAEETIGHRDARIRKLTVEALATAPTDRSIDLLSRALNDDVPAIRAEARGILLGMAARDALRPTVIAKAEQLLSGDRWRELEQAILILTELDQKQNGMRLLQLLRHARSEVLVTAAWGLRRLAVPVLVEPMFEEAQRFVALQPTSGEQREAFADAAAHLLEAMGQMNHQPADPFLRSFIPKASPYPETIRAAAVWALGHLWAGRAEHAEELARQLEGRLSDTGPPAEMYEVRVMSAVTLGRMGSQASLPVLRGWYETESPESYLGACCGWAIEQLTGETLPTPPVTTQQVTGWFLEPADLEEAGFLLGRPLSSQ